MAKKEGDNGGSFLSMNIGAKPKRGIKYPDKTTINLVRYEVERNNLKGILTIILITVVLIAFGKIGVYDQYTKLYEVQRQYGIVQEQLSSIRQENTRYAEVKAKYDEVTDWYMTSDEKALINKMEVLSMLEEDLMPFVEILRVQVSGSVVTVATGETDLSTVSQFLLKLQQDNRNTSATVTTTAAASSLDGEERVTASVIIDFRGGPSEAEADDYEQQEANREALQKVLEALQEE